MDRFWLVLSFLTTLPARQTAYRPDGLGRAAGWFPVVGLLIGLLLTGLHAGADALLGFPMAAVLVVTGWAALTGALHLDGLADCCDGLLAPVPVERRLEIMRDPRTGSFAVVGLVLALLTKTIAVYSLPMAWPALLLAPVWARWWILIAARQPVARPGGLGSSFAAALTARTLAQALVLPALLLVVAQWYDGRSLVGVAASGLACFLILRLSETRIGGVTGDVYGAVVEVTEIVLLIGLVRP